MELRAYAKLNLALEVLGKRSDGYHEVRTVMQTIDLADKLAARPADNLSVRCTDTTLNDQDNLVWKAATALANRAGVEPKAEIFLEKSIPVAMGLGGGSSDAAAAITSLNRLWGLGLPDNELTLVAAETGSDVAFFLTGGTALAGGRGEQISPVAPLPGTVTTLVCPNMEISNKTARLYSRLTPEHFSDGSRTDRLVENLKAGKSVSDILYNVFEEVAFDAFPGLARVRDRLIEATGRPPRLSGAGPALYFLPSSKDGYEAISNALQPNEARVYLVQTVDCGHLALAPG